MRKISGTERLPLDGDKVFIHDEYKRDIPQAYFSHKGVESMASYRLSQNCALNCSQPSFCFSF